MFSIMKPSPLGKTMNALKCLLIAFLTLTLPSTSIAQTKRVSYLSEGSEAKFDGFLLEPLVYFSLTGQIELLGAQLKNQENYITKREELNCLINNKLDVSDTSFWEENRMAIGVVLGIAGTIATFIVVDEISDRYIND